MVTQYQVSHQKKIVIVDESAHGCSRTQHRSLSVFIIVLSIVVPRYPFSSAIAYIFWLVLIVDHNSFLSYYLTCNSYLLSITLDSLAGLVVPFPPSLPSLLIVVTLAVGNKL